MKICFLSLCLLLNGVSSYCQQYNAVHGSDYAGSLGVANNPASIANSPYKWDITPVAFQYHLISNAVKGPNFPFVFRMNSPFLAAEGNFKRKADLNVSLRLFNTRISLDKTHAFAFGMNIRSYARAGTSRINYNESARSTLNFLTLNEPNHLLLAGKVVHSAWMEWYGSYGLALWDRSESRLNAGITVKLMKGVSGGFANVEGIKVTKAPVDEMDVFSIQNGSANYGLSANHDKWLRNNGSAMSINDFFQGSRAGLAFDLGMEYRIKTQAVTAVFDETGFPDYEWKIGFSLLDIGWNTYDYSEYSKDVAFLKPDVSSAVLQDKFIGITDINAFNDSLETIVNVSRVNGNAFRVINPTRLVINVDRSLPGNLFINGELSLSLSALAAHDKLYLRESKLVSITPRWETKRLGLFLPVQYNREGVLWIGGALKAGPLIIGSHNILNAFAKNKNINGGGYLALIIRPSEWMGRLLNRQYECPVF